MTVAEWPFDQAIMIEQKQILKDLAFDFHHAESQVELAKLYIDTEPASSHADKVMYLLNDSLPVLVESHILFSARFMKKAMASLEMALRPLNIMN